MEAGGLGFEAPMRYPSGDPRGESTPETWQPSQEHTLAGDVVRASYKCPWTFGIFVHPYRIKLISTKVKVLFSSCSLYSASPPFLFLNCLCVPFIPKAFIE